jgi:tetratricopeptide (TPR) repeat protein
MLKRVLPVFCLLFINSAANAQRNKAIAFYKAGIKYKQINNFAEAINSFSRAVLSDPKFDSAYVEMGNIFSRGGKIDSSIYYYNKALKVNANYTAALFGMGKIYRDAKQNLDSAIYYFNTAEKTDTTNKEIYYGLAWIYNAKKEYDKAIPYAVKSLEIDNTYKPAYGELGHAYRASKKYMEAIEQFKKNLAVSVVDVALLYSGYCYTELKNKEGALQLYAELKKVNEKMAESLKKKIDTMPDN